MKTKTKLFLLAITCSGSLFSQTLIIDDALTNGATIGEIYENRAIATSSFTTDGYMPGVNIANQNHILYDVPYMFKEGYIEFEFKGMEKPTNVNSDPAFCGLYDGKGIKEPIQYTNDFKQNYYRWNVHFRGDNFVFKCKIQTTANTEAKELRSKAVFIDYSTEPECLTEPNGSSMTWNKSQWYKMKVNWKNKTYTVSIDGVAKWSTTLGCDYMPRDMKIWLGCAPGYNGKYTASVPGLVFKNFKLYTYDTPKFNIGKGSVNFSTAGYVDFVNSTTNQDIFVQNLSATAMTLNIAKNNSYFASSQTNVDLAAGEKKTITLKMTAIVLGAVRTVFTITSPSLATSYTVTALGTSTNEGSPDASAVVTEYEDLFNDGVKSSLFIPENPLYHSFTESEGAMNIAVTKNNASNKFSAFIFNPKLITDSFLIDMSLNPYIAIKAKSDKAIMVQVGPVNYEQSGNPNCLPISDYANPVTDEIIELPNLPGDNQWHWLFFNFADRFQFNGVKGNFIKNVFFNFNPGSLLSANVSFDEFHVGAKALIYTGLKDSPIAGSSIPDFYPNPVSTSIYLRNPSDIKSLILKDINGREIVRLVPLNSEVSFASLPSGVYFITLRHLDSTNKTYKLIKQ